VSQHALFLRSGLRYSKWHYRFLFLPFIRVSSAHGHPSLRNAEHVGFRHQ